MRLIYAKVPQDNRSARTSYSLTDFFEINEFLEKYELLFDDISGYCYASPFSKTEIINNNCIFDITSVA